MNVSLAANLLNEGQVVAVPTETVYGLAANALNVSAVMDIFRIKGRPEFDPLIVHCLNKEQAFSYALNLPDLAFKLAESFWPGPLTLVLQSNGEIPSEVTSGLPTVALRVPSHPLFQELLNLLNFPLAAPSANPFGYVSPTTAEHVYAQLGSKIPYILNGGPCQYGLESTIVGFDKDLPVILRLGALTLKEIKTICPKLKIQLKSLSNPKSPGQLSVHYAPSKKVIFIHNQDVPPPSHSNMAFLSFGGQPIPEGYTELSLSKNGDYFEAARNLYKLLRTFDSGPWSELVTTALPEDDSGLAMAINDRLTRAAAQSITHL